MIGWKARNVKEVPNLMMIVHIFVFLVIKYFLAHYEHFKHAESKAFFFIQVTLFKNNFIHAILFQLENNKNTNITTSAKLSSHKNFASMYVFKFIIYLDKKNTLQIIEIHLCFTRRNKFPLLKKFEKNLRRMIAYNRVLCI